MATNATQPDAAVRGGSASAESVTMTLVAAALSVVSVVTNSLLVYVVARTPALHTPTNVFIASLAVAELVTGLFVVPFAGASLGSSQWAFSPETCYVTAALGLLGRCSASLNLMAVSADRCVAISKPLRYASIVTKQSTMVAIAMIWVHSLVMAALPSMNWGVYSYSDTFRMCLMRSCSNVDRHGVAASAYGLSNNKEVLLVEALCSFGPAVVVMLLVVVTMHQIRGHRRVFALVPVPISATSLPEGTRPVASSALKALRSLLLITVAYVGLYLPSSVARVLCGQQATCISQPVLLRLLMWLSFLCSVIYPIIIISLNQKFRAALHMLVRSIPCRMLNRSLTGDKELFTITSGLNTILDATLAGNIIHRSGGQNVSFRRHIILRQKTAMADMHAPIFVRRVGFLTLRKSQSTPECHANGMRVEP